MNVSLLWVHLPEPGDSAGKRQVQVWTMDLGLRIAPLTKSRSRRAFDAATERVTSYSVDGKQVELSTVKGKSTRDFVTYSVVRTAEEGPPRPVAQLRLYLPRRTASGTVKNSTSLETKILGAVAGADRTEITKYLKKVSDAFDKALDLIDPHAMRRIVTNSVDERGVPAPGRGLSWFVYEEDVEIRDRLQVFFDRVGTGGQTWLLRLHDGEAERELVAVAAEQDMLERAEELRVAGELALATEATTTRLRRQGAVRDNLRLLRAQIERHEARLAYPLPAATTRVAEIEEELGAARAKPR